MWISWSAAHGNRERAFGARIQFGADCYGTLRGIHGQQDQWGKGEG